ncbi:MAG: sulfurtransferase TusA family protein [Candidatus Margulisiibacteriota bacterium]|nr:sulfurtransferase TusA family protein [Candidatus Margulisiibacteriota bacterium]
MEANKKVDCYGLLCPMPIVLTADTIKGMEIGEILEVRASDEGIKHDMPAWCKVTGQRFMGIEERDGEYFAYVQKIKA